MKKRFLALAAIFSLSSAIPAYAGIGVTIDGIPVNFTAASGAPTVDENSRTLVPLRAAMEAYGCTVTWDQSSQRAYVSKNGITVMIPMDVTLIDVNGTPVFIDTSAKIIDGRVYLPIRAVLEAFNATVGWDEKSQNVVIITGNTPNGINDQEKWYEDQQKQIEEELKKQQEEKARQEEEQRRYEERKKEIEEFNRQIEADIKKRQEESKNRYESALKEREEMQAEFESLRNEMLASEKEMQETIQEMQSAAENAKQDAIYDSLSNTGGYGNSHAISQGYYNPNMFGGYGSTYAEAAYQQYLDNLLVTSKYK